MPREIFTIGYEGASPDAFATTLKDAGVAVVADVRAVALSRKRGFSKSALRESLETQGLGYRHYIALGTPKPGREAAEIVAEVLERTVRDFPWPKSMRWGTGSLRWVRPLHSILCLLVGDEGSQVVPLEIDGIRAGNVTRGHRFHAPDAFAVTSFEDYEAKLGRAHVVLWAEERRDRIRHDAATLAFARGW